jgi:formylglycine-generating enzyme required for sulfatase activity
LFLGTKNQQGQTIEGNQFNIGGDTTVDQLGDRYHIEQATVNLPPDLVRRLLTAAEGEDLTVAELATQYWEPQTLFVPAGPFLMGSTPRDGIPDHETPQFELTLPGYRIGKYPVTNEQFARFIWQTNRVAGPVLLWDGNQPAEEKLHQPVSGVTWYEALDYCQWLSEETGRLYTLPTEAQWERAARGTAGTLYPWGNDWDPAHCNVQKELITAVTAYPAQNDLGCYDLAGNTREWTLTAWGQERDHPDKKYTYPREDDRRNGVQEPATTRRIFRGGWASEPTGFRCSARAAYLPQKSGPKYKRHGFRIALLPIK